MLANNAQAAGRSAESAIVGLQGLPLGEPVSAAAVQNTRRVFVDSGLTLRGEFRACDHLAIAGHVESDIALHVLDILEPGSFKGSATVEEARIAGRYEGALTVAETLVVGSDAYISGSVRCGRLRLEEGGKIDGDLRVLSDEAGAAARAGDNAASPAPVLHASPGIAADADRGVVDDTSSGPPGRFDVMLAQAAAVQDDTLIAEAEASFRAALKANVFDIAALSGLGHLARQRGDLAGALSYFQMIMAADAENISVRSVAIDILNALSRREEAAALAKEVDALRAQHARAPRDVPNERAASAGFDEAEAMFKSVLERHPKNLGALAGLGHLARRRGDRVAMLKYYTGALALEPTNISMRVEVAHALREQGEAALAQQILETVLAERRESQSLG